MLQHLETRETVDLASEPAFHLGPLLVDPARLTIANGDQTETLEPRVMMVLVVLAAAEGRVVSRDELVERCWDGRIVADNAVQRVISRLRHVSHTLGGFEIQTVTKVGYLVRPVEDCDASEAAEARKAAVARPDRRQMLLGAGALLLAGGAGLVAWRKLKAGDPDADAARGLLTKARDIQLTDMPDSTDQAIAYLTRATELDPQSSAAWGALAMAYHQKLETGGDYRAEAIAGWCRSAATNALAIDGNNIEARLAMATIRPNFRNWAANERALRRLMAAHPPHPGVDGALGWLLCDTGRWTDAIGLFRRALAAEPFHPDNQLILAWGLWGGGHLAEADRLLAGARELWPRSRSIWQTAFDFLATTGSPMKAIAMLDDVDALPPVPPREPAPPYDLLRRFALHMADNPAADSRALASEIRDARGLINTISTVTYLCALGQVEPALDILEGYYFGNEWRPPPGPLSRRKTAMLFAEKWAALRRSPRHARMIDRVGLPAYWQATGTRPDAKPGLAIHL